LASTFRVADSAMAAIRLEIREAFTYLSLAWRLEGKIDPLQSGGWQIRVGLSS
jgi:hypothetical protein